MMAFLNHLQYIQRVNHFPSILNIPPCQLLLIHGLLFIKGTFETIIRQEKTFLVKTFQKYTELLISLCFYWKISTIFFYLQLVLCANALYTGVNRARKGEKGRKGFLYLSSQRKVTDSSMTRSPHFVTFFENTKKNFHSQSILIFNRNFANVIQLQRKD